MDKGCWILVASLTGRVIFWIELGEPTPGQMRSMQYFKLDDTMSDTYGGFVDRCNR